MIMADQKKILILGGTKHMVDSVESAKRLGMSTVVVDNVMDAPAKEFADKSFNINAADTRRLVKVVEEEGLDGVYTVFDGINIWHVIALCKKAKIPIYTSSEIQLALMPGMEKFVDICRCFEIPIIEQNKIAAEFGDVAHYLWEFPVLVKPVKNAAPGRKPLETLNFK